MTYSKVVKYLQMAQKEANRVDDNIDLFAARSLPEIFLAQHFGHKWIYEQQGPDATDPGNETILYEYKIATVDKNDEGEDITFRISDPVRRAGHERLEDKLFEARNNKECMKTILYDGAHKHYANYKSIIIAKRDKAGLIIDESASIPSPYVMDQWLFIIYLLEQFEKKYERKKIKWDFKEKEKIEIGTKYDAIVKSVKEIKERISSDYDSHKEYSKDCIRRSSTDKYIKEYNLSERDAKILRKRFISGYSAERISKYCISGLDVYECKYLCNKFVKKHFERIKSN